jgi:hypothetical protein
MALPPLNLGLRSGRKSRRRSIDDLDLTFLKIELLKKNMTLRDLAAKAGMALKTCENIACGDNRFRAGRAKINAALGKQIFPID